MAVIADLLKEARFGSRIAEEEIDEPLLYFVETEQWRKLLSGEVDIVFGSKGSGKSALYSLLVLKKEELRLGKRTVFIAAENPRGTPVFRDLVTEPPISEESFRSLWKLYFLSIAANYIRHHMEASGLKNDNATIVIEYLAKNDLLAPNITLISRLKSVIAYIRNRLPTLEATMTDPNTGIEFSGKISLIEPTPEQRKAGWRSLDDLMESLNTALSQLHITIWLALDRLDVAFADSEALEGNSIRSLFRAYLDMLSLTQINLKIFLRDDIWKAVVISGFREASHITRSINLVWDKQSLQNLIIRRLVSNEKICIHYSVRKEEVWAICLCKKNYFRKYSLKR